MAEYVKFMFLLRKNIGRNVVADTAAVAQPGPPHPLDSSNYETLELAGVESNYTSLEI